MALAAAATTQTLTARALANGAAFSSLMLLGYVLRAAAATLAWTGARTNKNNGQGCSPYPKHIMAIHNLYAHIP